MSTLPQRKRPAHPTPVERSRDPTVLFVTVCVKDRTLRLTNRNTHSSLVEAWKRAGAWRVGWYMIMPDHVHLFCSPGTWPAVAIKSWCKYWKGQFRRIMELDDTVWLRDCWDTQIRSYEHYVEKRSYVSMNPVRKGLVAASDDWPYQGELHAIVW